MTADLLAPNNRCAVDKILASEKGRVEIALGDQLQNSAPADAQPFGGIACGAQIHVRTTTLPQSE